MANYLRSVAEVVVFVICFLSAWPFGSVEPYWEFILAVGIALLALLWAIQGIVVQRFLFRLDLPTIVLGGILLISLVQLVPFPSGYVRLVSPARSSLNEQLLNQSMERLPGETEVLGKSTIPLSVNPEGTRSFSLKLAGILIVYTTVRNWLVSRDALKRMAWAGMVTGATLALFAMVQKFSAPPGSIFWDPSVAGDPYGTFVNRNHYVDFIVLCMGWTLALMLVSKKQNAGNESENAFSFLDLLTKPVALAAAISLLLMVLSTIFSLSRGGTISVFLAIIGIWFGLLNSHFRRHNRNFLLLFMLALGGAVIFFGIAPLEARVVATASPDDRLPLWRGALSQIPGFPLLGSGNGTFSRIEPLARPQTDQPYSQYTNAHNEYVEALLEGGIVRFALTTLLVFATVVQLGRAYRRRAERVTGPYILGIWFGLFAIAAHAMTDFGIHIPSVAVFATVTLASGMAAAHDPEFGYHRKRRRKSATPEVAEALPNLIADKQKPEIEVRGVFAIAVALLIAGTGIVVALDLRNYASFYEYWLAGKLMGRPADPALAERKIELLRAATLLRPLESTGHLDLGKARIQAACDRSLLPLGAVVGSAFPRPSTDHLNSPVFIAMLRLGLNDLRTARNLSPLYPETHLLLGQFAEGFEHADPPLTYFERAKILNKSDPNIWFACGRAHFDAGNDAGAAENWRHSLELSTQQLPAILALARTRLSTDDMIARILPDNPITLVQAAEYFRDEPKSRNTILDRAANADEKPSWTWKARVATAEASDLLGRTVESEALWNRAMAADPEQFEVRNGYSLFLEREERYEEALTQLTWLIKKSPSNGQLRDRALFVKHGVDLNEKLKQ